VFLVYHIVNKKKLPDILFWKNDIRQLLAWFKEYISEFFHSLVSDTSKIRIKTQCEYLRTSYLQDFQLFFEWFRGGNAKRSITKLCSHFVDLCFKSLFFRPLYELSAMEFAWRLHDQYSFALRYVLLIEYTKSVMKKIYITRAIPQTGIDMLINKGYEVDVSAKDGVLSKSEFVAALLKKEYNAVLCLLTDTIDREVFDAAPHATIFANYAVGFNNIDSIEAKKRGITITNTPDVLTDTVAEHTFALLMAVALRIPEADRFTRRGEYEGWAPMLFLGTDISRKTLGILGAGRIGSRVARIGAKGYDMRVIYYDIKRNDIIEKESGAEFRENAEDVLKEADFVTVHVPLLDSTRHLINTERLAMMKPGAYLVNTSRGPVIDEVALVHALKTGVIKGAALDVFENEPKLALGLSECENVVITPHIASATEETRGAMAEIAATSIIDFLEGKKPKNIVT